MPLARTYTNADVKAAIDLAEGHRFSSFSTVWGGNESHWQSRDIIHPTTLEKIKTIEKHAPPAAEKESVSSDEGHTLRNHVKGHQQAAYVGTKSRYDDLPSCIGATTEALNSTKGQQILGEMDADPTCTNRKIIFDVTGDWYGDAADGVKKKIATIAIIVMPLGRNTLWIHTSYPTHFVT